MSSVGCDVPPFNLSGAHYKTDEVNRAKLFIGLKDIAVPKAESSLTTSGPNITQISTETISKLSQRRIEIEQEIVALDSERVRINSIIKDMQ